MLVMRIICMLKVFLRGDPPPLIMASALLSLLTTPLRAASLLHLISRQAMESDCLFKAEKRAGVSLLMPSDTNARCIRIATAAIEGPTHCIGTSDEHAFGSWTHGSTANVKWRSLRQVR